MTRRQAQIIALEKASGVVVELASTAEWFLDLPEEDERKVWKAMEDIATSLDRKLARLIAAENRRSN